MAGLKMQTVSNLLLRSELPSGLLEVCGILYIILIILTFLNLFLYCVNYCFWLIEAAIKGDVSFTGI